MGDRPYTPGQNGGARVVTPRIRVVIVDDEPLARARVRAILARSPDVEIIGECVDGTDALEAIPHLAPDIVLLDVQMPGLDGFGVVERLPEPRPAIVFVTAHDRHAVRAFDVHALDYVLKPFEPERLLAAVERARKQPSPPHDWQALLAELRTAPAYIERVAIRLGDRIYYVVLNDVDWIEADGNYVRLHTGTRSHLLRRSLRQMAVELDPKRFARVHRSSIVNIDRVRELRVLPDGDFTVELVTGVKLKLMRRYRELLP